ncbi:MAG: eight-cysteine-cluster domain-containing protein [Candidatus Aenigmatarchaeota archaeon]
MKNLILSLIIALSIIFSILILSKKENVEFCGISTYGKCYNDEDCIVSGCNNEVCQSKYEEIIFTPCIFKECHKNLNFSCKCIENKCSWIKSFSGP